MPSKQPAIKLSSSNLNNYAKLNSIKVNLANYLSELNRSVERAVLVILPARIRINRHPIQYLDSGQFNQKKRIFILSFISIRPICKLCAFRNETTGQAWACGSAQTHLSDIVAATSWLAYCIQDWLNLRIIVTSPTQLAENYKKAGKSQPTTLFF